MFKVGARLVCVLSLWAVTTGVITASAAAAKTSGSSSLFDKLFEDPNDVDLNRKYAREAEAQGKVRLALAALERARAVRPDDREIASEFERLRNELLPSVTAVIWQIGGAYTSNPRQVRGGRLKHEDGVFDGSVIVQDERTLLARRWRTLASAAGQLNVRFEEISADRLAIESGPILPLNDDIWMQVAPGTSVVWLNGKQLYSDVSAAVTFGAPLWGMTQTLTARYQWRSGDNYGYSDAKVLDVFARVVTRPGFIRGDGLYFDPRYRLSNPDGSRPANLILATAISTSTIVARDLAPQQYQEWGARASYMFPIAQGKAWLGAGLAIYDRHFDSPVLDANALAQGVTVGTGKDRHDVYFEPTAHVILPDLVAPNVDLRFDYRYEINTSNDASRDYQNHVVGLRVVGRF